MNRILIVAALAASSSIAAAQAVSVRLSEWKISLSRDTVRAGSVNFRVSNDGSMNHAFYVRGPGVAKGMREIAQGESASLTVTLTPGTYDVYCPLSDGSHRQAGMAKTLVVLPAAASAPPHKKPNA